MLLEQLIPLKALSEEQRLRGGIDERIFSLIEINGGKVENLYIVKNDIIFPVAYFDKENNFQFRFSPFVDGWEDVSQMKRFGKQLAAHNIQSSHLLN